MQGQVVLEVTLAVNTNLDSLSKTSNGSEITVSLPRTLNLEVSC